MTRFDRADRLERDLTVWFAETAAPRTPPYLDDILRQTAHRRQRPRWTFFERLLPMTATTSLRAATGNVPWRALGVLAILVLALVVGAVLIGSTQHQLPAPFGPARAGQVTYAMDGDIYVVTPTTVAMPDPFSACTSTRGKWAGSANFTNPM